MEENNQKERLEQELGFLKESYEAEVISKDEYEKGKERIEQKLKKINSNSNDDNQWFEGNTKGQENKTDAEIDKPKERSVIEDAAAPLDVKQSEIKPTSADEVPKYDGKKEDKLFKYAVVFVVLALILFFSYSLLTPREKQKEATMKFAVECSSDADCIQEGKMGVCRNPGKDNSECHYVEDQKTNVLVLNSRQECFNCETQRVLDILTSWFGSLNVREIDYSTEEGKKLTDAVDAKILPAYLLEDNITQKPAFESLKQAFTKKDNYYVMSESAAGSTFYVNRDYIQNKLDFFVKEGDGASIKAEKNLKEFLDSFSNIKFQRHTSKSELSRELEIKTFPSFFVNNKIKFSGVYPAEEIRQKFCSLNKLEECEKKLSKNLV